MNRLFGAKKNQPPPPPPPKKEQEPAPKVPEKQMVSLSDQQQRLENKVREISETVTKLDNEAKDLLQKSKRSKGSAKEMYKQRCVMVLKKRKQYDNQLKNYMNQQMTLNQVAFTSDNIQNTLQMGETMKNVVQQQKQTMSNLDMDKLDDIRDEMQELKYESDYMNEMLNRDYDLDVDQDELDDELQGLQKEIKFEKMQKTKQQQKPMAN